jgi:hypothetical protein
MKKISDFGFRISVDWRSFRQCAERPGDPKSSARQHSLRSLVAVALCVCVLGVSTLSGGCKRRDKKIRIQTDEDTITPAPAASATAPMASVIQMGDPKAQPQLLHGFYNIESNTWRWTMGKFGVALRPPRNASVRGAILHLKFVLPESVLSKIKTTSISAKVDGVPLARETYTQPGEFDYSREVNANLLSGDVVNVEFSLDKFLPAGMVELRELGVIATSVGFEVK